MSTSALDNVPMYILRRPALVSCKLDILRYPDELANLISAALTKPARLREQKLKVWGIRSLHITWVGGEWDG